MRGGAGVRIASGTGSENNTCQTKQTVALPQSLCHSDLRRFWLILPSGVCTLSPDACFPQKCELYVSPGMSNIYMSNLHSHLTSLCAKDLDSPMPCNEVMPDGKTQEQAQWRGGEGREAEYIQVSASISRMRSELNSSTGHTICDRGGW